MTERRERLWLRRQALLRESADLRDRLHQHALALGPLWRGADTAWLTAHWLRRHPWVPALAALWLAWRRPRMVWRWGRRAWSAWGLLTRVRQTWLAAKAQLRP